MNLFKRAGMALAVLTLTVAALAVPRSQAHADPASFKTLSDPHGSSTNPTGINNCGQVVGNYSSKTGEMLDFTLLTGAYKTVSFPNASSTYVSGINDNGQIVGYFTDAKGQHGFVLSNGVYTPVDCPNSFESNGNGTTSVNGINNLGQIVGSYLDSTTGTIRGFILTGSTFTLLDGSATASSTVANGINDCGQVVGYYVDQTVQYGFVWSKGTYILLGTSGWVVTTPASINNLGQVVGYFHLSTDMVDWHSFIWNAGAYTSADLPGTVSTQATGINGEGQIVGTYSTGVGPQGYLYTP